MSSDSDTDDASKTEEATPEKKRKAREEGQFPRSRDAGAVAASAAVMLTILGLGPRIARTIGDFTTRCLDTPGGFVPENLESIGQQLMLTIAIVSLPTGIAASLAAIAMGFVEAGFQPRMQLAGPKLSRLNPLGKLKGMVSPKSSATNVALSLGRVLVVGGATYAVMRNDFGTLVSLTRAELSSSVVTILWICLKMVAASVVVLACLSALDFIQAFVKHNQELKMTRQEVKDEMQQQEGDPKVKARQRQRGRELARRGIAQELKKCEVVVANPTHIAVGLRYLPEEGAPVVGVKGYEEVALYIRRLAKEYGIPVIENRPLARALAEKVRLGRAIPVDLYTAVAEVLAMVYRLKNRLPDEQTLRG